MAPWCEPLHERSLNGTKISFFAARSCPVHAAPLASRNTLNIRSFASRLLTSHVASFFFLRKHLCTAVLLLAAALPAAAQVSREAAAAMAQRQTGGRVLSVDRAESGGRAVWRVKVVTPRGDVRVVLIDAGGGGGGGDDRRRR